MSEAAKHAEAAERREPMIDAREVARRLGVSVDVVYRETAAGRLPAVRIGGTHGVIRYSWAKVEAAGEAAQLETIGAKL